jgi:hypothetical protein
MVGASIGQHGQSAEGVVDLHYFIAKLIIMIGFTMKAVECGKLLLLVIEWISPFLRCCRSL